MKDFYTWNEKKILIDSNKKFNHPREKEIWWCSVGLNIGTEIFGKGELYTRPVLIINSESSESFIGIPLTSKLKTGKYSCVIRSSDNTLHTALTYQISFDKRRLTKKIYNLEDSEYKKSNKQNSNLIQNIIAPFGTIGSDEQKRKPLNARIIFP